MTSSPPLVFKFDAPLNYKFCNSLDKRNTCRVHFVQYYIVHNQTLIPYKYIYDSDYYLWIFYRHFKQIIKHETNACHL